MNWYVVIDKKTGKANYGQFPTAHEAARAFGFETWRAGICRDEAQAATTAYNHNNWAGIITYGGPKNEIVDMREQR